MRNASINPIPEISHFASGVVQCDRVSPLVPTPSAGIVQAVTAVVIISVNVSWPGDRHFFVHVVGVGVLLNPRLVHSQRALPNEL